MKKGNLLIAFCLVLTLLCTTTVGTFTASARDWDNLVEEGIGYLYGTGPDGFDLEEADSCFFFARGDDPLASYYSGLVEMYSDDPGRFDYAMDYFKEAWEEGCPLGLVGTGLLYEFGRGVLPGYRQALECYQLALDEGCVEANYGMGNLYLYGHGVEADTDKAREYFTKALESEEFGFANDSLLALAAISIDEADDDDPDYSEALAYIEEAMDNGYAEAYLYMGTLYENGIGVKQSTAKALRNYRKAAELGCFYACNYVGMAYYSGDGVTEDLETAVEWFRLGAENGDATGMYNLAYMYESGEGVDEDLDEATEWYEAAAWSGDTDAMYTLGWLLMDEGDLGSLEEALWWFFCARLYAPEDEDIAEGVEEALDVMAENEELVEGGFTREYLADIVDGWNRVGEYLWISPELEGQWLSRDELEELAEDEEQTVLLLDFDFTGSISSGEVEVELTWEPDFLYSEDETAEMTVDGDYLTLTEGEETMVFRRYYAPW